VEKNAIPKILKPVSVESSEGAVTLETVGVLPIVAIRIGYIGGIGAVVVIVVMVMVKVVPRSVFYDVVSVSAARRRCGASWRGGSECSYREFGTGHHCKHFHPRDRPDKRCRH
jgi:hypothetical protein